MTFDKKAYQREYMKKKRLEKKGLVWVEEEPKAEATVPRTEMESQAEVVVTYGVDHYATLTLTDRKFEEMKPGYWIYGKEVKKRECVECGKKFETRMELNRFCGPGCKKKFLDTHFSTAGIKE